MDCVIIAGGIPGESDLLYPLTQGNPKALLPMGGRTMLERLIDALQGCEEIEEIVIVGLGDDRGQNFIRPVHHLPDHGGMVPNVLAGIAAIRQIKPHLSNVLLSSADIPAITPEIVSAFLQSCQPLDKGVYYNFVTREVMEKRFPTSNRTFVKLKDAEIAGGDMLLIDVRLADSNQELWEALANARKAAWQLARLVGFGFLLKFFLRRISLPEIETKAGQLIGYPAKILLNPHAEIAMDADKPEQVLLLQRELQVD